MSKEELVLLPDPDLILKDIKFFLEQLNNPNLSQRNINLMNDIITQLMNRYCNPFVSIEVKV